MKAKLFFAACIAALSGCNATPGVAPAPDVTPLEAAGDYVHPASGFVFPADNAGFHRVSLYRRGTDASRITAGYAGGPPRCLTAVTMFIDPVTPGEDTDQAFARARAETLKSRPSATLESEDSRDDATFPGRRAIFVDGDRRVEVGLLRAKGEWDVTHRAVYPVQCAAEVRDRLGNFLPGWRR